MINKDSVSKCAQGIFFSASHAFTMRRHHNTLHFSLAACSTRAFTCAKFSMTTTARAAVQDGSFLHLQFFNMNMYIGTVIYTRILFTINASYTQGP